MRNLSKWGGLVGLAGGVFWIVKVILVYIFLAANSPEPVLLIGPFYFGGLLGAIGAGFALSGLVLASRNAVVRVIVGLPAAFVLLFITFAVQDPLEVPFRGAFDEDVVTEIPILILGVFWAIVGALLWRRSARRSGMLMTKGES